jgi:hypothetical protein
MPTMTNPVANILLWRNTKSASCICQNVRFAAGRHRRIVRLSDTFNADAEYKLATITSQRVK